MSQQTENYNFNLIETTDKIADSLNDLNDNFESLDEILSSISGISFEIVQTLPATGESGIIYLVPNSGSGESVYDEYIWINNAFELIGSTAIDLSDYYTKSQVDTKLAEKAEKSEVDMITSNNTKTSTKSTALNLTDSLNGLIKYMVIYGNTEQDNTPTPSEPVDVEIVTGDVTVTVTDGDQATQSQLLSLGNIELCKIGDYQDYIYKDKTSGKWYVKRNIGKVVLNGTESGWWWNSQNNRAQGPLLNALHDKKLYSNYFKTGQNYNDNTVNSAYVYGTALMWIYLDNTQFTNLSQFQTWLSTHNTIVYYVLATLSDEEITDTTLIAQLEALFNLQTYKPITNVYTTTQNLNPELTIDYEAEQYIKNNVINEIWKGTQTEYDNLGTYSDTTLYLIEEE